MPMPGSLEELSLALEGAAFDKVGDVAVAGVWPDHFVVVDLEGEVKSLAFSYDPAADQLVVEAPVLVDDAEAKDAAYDAVLEKGGGGDVTDTLTDAELALLFADLDEGDLTAVGETLDTIESKVAKTPKGVAATERLKEYWVTGEGGQKIRWGVAGDFVRCVTEVTKYLPDNEVKGYCALRHKDATGASPGHAASEGGKSLEGKALGGATCAFCKKDATTEVLAGGSGCTTCDAHVALGKTAMRAKYRGNPVAKPLNGAASSSDHGTSTANAATGAIGEGKAMGGKTCAFCKKDATKKITTDGSGSVATTCDAHVDLGKAAVRKSGGGTPKADSLPAGFVAHEGKDGGGTDEDGSYTPENFQGKGMGGAYVTLPGSWEAAMAALGDEIQDSMVPDHADAMGLLGPAVPGSLDPRVYSDIIATFDDYLVVRLSTYGGGDADDTYWQVPYTLDDDGDDAELGTPVRVEIQAVIVAPDEPLEPDQPTPDPDMGSDDDDTGAADTPTTISPDIARALWMQALQSAPTGAH